MTRPTDGDRPEDSPRGDWGSVYLEIVDEDEDEPGLTEDQARRLMEQPAADVGRSSTREGA